MNRTRLLMRAGQEYVLRSLILIGSHFDGDFTRGAIWLAINNASTGHLMDDQSLGAAFAYEGSPAPNEVRRPVSRLAVSTALGIPFETVRRHCKALVAGGWCIEIKGRGLIVDAERMNEVTYAATRQANVANVRQFLRRLGVNPPVAAADAPPAR